MSILQNNYVEENSIVVLRFTTDEYVKPMSIRGIRWVLSLGYTNFDLLISAVV